MKRTGHNSHLEKKLHISKVISQLSLQHCFGIAISLTSFKNININNLSLSSSSLPIYHSPIVTLFISKKKQSLKKKKTQSLAYGNFV